MADKPLIQYAVEEALVAGFHVMAFIVGRSKDARTGERMLIKSRALEVPYGTHSVSTPCTTQS